MSQEQFEKLLAVLDRIAGALETISNVKVQQRLAEMGLVDLDGVVEPGEWRNGRVVRTEGGGK
jgi:hypothetical protein